MKNQQDKLQETAMKAFPDLLTNQDSHKLEALIEQRKLLDQQKQQLKQEQQALKLKRPQRQLTDHLVYYPSQQSITDYNSSMNLEYQREYPRNEVQHQNLQHDEFMQHAHAQQQVHLQRQLRLEGKEEVKKERSEKKHQYLNKVQGWLPDIKLKKMSKRHRSHSLPGQVDNEEYYQNQEYKMNIQQKPHKHTPQQHGKKGDIYVMKSYMKGKKKDLVRTMSSIMHKAQKTYRRHSISHHHLSDEDGTKSMPTSAPHSSSKRSYSDTETDISSMFSDNDDSEMHGPLFATMGDSVTKHSDAGDSDRPVSDSSTGSKKKIQEDGSNQFNLNFTSTSMEFAASRKVGIFRKKSSNNEEDGHSPTEVEVKKPSGHVLVKTHSIFVDSIDDEKSEKPVAAPRHEFEQVKPIPSPRFEHSRSSSIKTGQSLDVPQDEDSKSQNSYRTSISSRRQSTEDSIDTDDEYFKYEMKNLEELERNSHMEAMLQDNKNELINNIIQLDNSLIEPDDSVKKNMTYVLHELKAKVKLREPVDDIKQDIVNNNNKKKDIYDKFANINDMPWNRDSDDDYNCMNELNQFENEIRDSSYGKVKKKRKKREKYEKSSSSSADDEDDKSIASDNHLGVDKFERPHSQSSGLNEIFFVRS
jgi:hypothetical protein